MPVPCKNGFNSLKVWVKKAESTFGRFLVKFDAKGVSAGTAQNHSPLGSEILIKKIAPDLVCLSLPYVWHYCCKRQALYLPIEKLSKRGMCFLNFLIGEGKSIKIYYPLQRHS